MFAVINCCVSTIRKVVVSWKNVDEIIKLLNNGGLVRTIEKYPLILRLVEEKRRNSDTKMRHNGSAEVRP